MNLLTETLLTQHLALLAASRAPRRTLLSKTPARGGSDARHGGNGRHSTDSGHSTRGAIFLPLFRPLTAQEHPPLPRFGFPDSTTSQSHKPGYPLDLPFSFKLFLLLLFFFQKHQPEIKVRCEAETIRHGNSRNNLIKFLKISMLE